MPALPAYALHAFGRQLPSRGRLFINFMIEKLSSLDLRAAQFFRLLPAT